MTEALQVYWPACDVITGSRVYITVKFMSLANTLSPGPISSTVGDTARYGISVTVHCTVCESPAVTVESSGEIITRAGEWSSVNNTYNMHHKGQRWSTCRKSIERIETLTE